MSRVALVVPTIRENSFREFIKRWEAMGLYQACDLIVMEDNPKPTFAMSTFVDPRWAATHLSWEDIEADLGEDSWIIPRRSDTVRSYAYFYAWKMGYEFVLTLDDDCYPPQDSDGLRYEGTALVDIHMNHLTRRTRWFNTLSKVKPRGVPFYNTGNDERSVLNHGLWTNVLDYDAPYQLANPIPEEFSFDNRIVPAGSYFPMCGMNVMWRREWTVAMYHLLMGQRVTEWYSNGARSKELTGVGDVPELERLPFDRFGDIWCGIIMKKIADVLGYRVSTGMPYIRHERASNPFTNLKKEANGIEVNEKFWEYVDRWNGLAADFTDNEAGIYAAYYDMGQHIQSYGEFPEHDEYFESLGKAMKIWANLFRNELERLHNLPVPQAVEEF